MIRRSSTIGALMLAVLCFAAPLHAAAQDARAFVSALGRQAIEVLGPNVPESQRVARFRQLFRTDFDVPGIGRFVLGRYWRIATPEQRQEFLGLFQEYVVRAYAVRLGEYGGEPFRVTGARPAGGETIVSSQIDRSGGAPIIVDWYLINEGGQYKISDVYIGGVSMKVTQRDEFASVIQRNGGVPGLIAELRQKLAQS
jgi:phospholipid transport system substrate-binding protein